MKHELYLGIDGGGSKCKARLELANGELLGEGIAGPANPVHDAELAFDSIASAGRDALVNAGFSANDLSQVHAVLGLAGVNIPKYYHLLEAWKHPFKQRFITTDLHIACLGAHGGHEGAIVITGTGSSAFASVAGKQLLLGGHGFPLGDKAGGAWLGWRAIGVVLDTFDGLLPQSAFVHDICNSLQVASADDLVTKALRFLPKDYATLAPVVIKAAAAQDVQAVAIMQEGADYLQQLIGRLLEQQPERISVIGGLANRWLEWLPDSTKSLLKSPLCSPEYGAVALAKQMFKES